MASRQEFCYCLFWFITMSLVNPVFTALAQDVLVDSITKQASPSHSVVISKATTFFTRPIGPDGCIDYVAAMAEFLRADAESIDNGAPVVFTYFDLRHDYEPDLPVHVSAFLNIQDTAGRRHIVSLNKYVSDMDSADTSARIHLDNVLANGWKDEQRLCVLSGWIDRNADTLDLFERDMANVNGYYAFPEAKAERVSLDDFLDVVMRLGSPMRDTTELLAARAERAIFRRNEQEAISAVRTLFNLARVADQMPSLDRQFLAARIERRACVTAARLLETGIEAKSLREYVFRLRSLQGSVRAVDVFHRVGILQSTVRHSAKRPNINSVLKEVNTLYDQMVDCLDEADFVSSQDKVREFVATVVKRSEEHPLMTVLRGTVAEQSAIHIFMVGLPDVVGLLQSRSEAVAYRKCLLAATATVEYRRLNGRWPDTIQDLGSVCKTDPEAFAGWEKTITIENVRSECVRVAVQMPRGTGQWWISVHPRP